MTLCCTATFWSEAVKPQKETFVKDIYLTFYKSLTYKPLASKTEIDNLRERGNTTKEKRQLFLIDKSLLMRNIYISVEQVASTSFSKRQVKFRNKGRRTLGPQCTEQWTETQTVR